MELILKVEQVDEIITTLTDGMHSLSVLKIKPTFKKSTVPLVL
jgi:hypothetical protein